MSNSRMMRIALCLGASMAFAAPQWAQTRIMPLGDSITAAEAGHASYRYWLWHQLMDSGYSVDFVGTKSGVYGGSPLYPEFDQDHEGHWGWRAEEVAANVFGWASEKHPEIVLMHLGHNDLFWNQGVGETRDELRTIVGELRRANPTVLVLLAQLIPGTPPELNSVGDLNTEIAVLADSLTNPVSPVIVVDHWTGFDPAADTYDGTHPNEIGERKLANRWYEALAGLPRRIDRRPPPPRRPTGRAAPEGWIE